MTDIFHDGDTTAAQKAGGVVAVGSWTLHLPQAFGFCGGVQHALKTLQHTLATRGTRTVWLLGQIIHNDTVNAFFRTQGAHILPEQQIDSVFARAAPDDIIVIPAFGVPLDLDSRLRAFCRSPDQLVDTTCRYVKRIWTFVEAMAAEKRTILIHGKPDHPETRATLSRALTPENAVILIPDLAAARHLADLIRRRALAEVPQSLVRNPGRLTLERMALVNQTTMLYQETKEIDAVIHDALDSVRGSLALAETLCRATQDRQNAATELCRKGCDLAIVVGGFSSSNTTQLYRLAKEYCPTYFIRDATALTRAEIRHHHPDRHETAVTRDWLPASVRHIGILAGASCPPCDIGDVLRRFRALAGEAEIR